MSLGGDDVRRILQQILNRALSNATLTPPSLGGDAGGEGSLVRPLPPTPALLRERDESSEESDAEQTPPRSVSPQVQDDHPQPQTSAQPDTQVGFFSLFWDVDIFLVSKMTENLYFFTEMLFF
jgi:hypothetical protein